MFKKNLVNIVIGSAVIIILAVLLYPQYSPLLFNGKISKEKAAQKTIEYIKKELLPADAKAIITLLGVKEENGLYDINFSLKDETNNVDEKVDVFVTLDGAFLYLDKGIDMNKSSLNNTDNSSADNGVKTCEAVQKEDTSALEAFVVSQCPFGLQMQRVLAELVSKIPSLKESIKVKYIGAIENGKITAMHGDAEAQENLKQICIREETSKYWEYISCYLKDGDSNKCSTSLGIDVSSCISNPEKGLKYAQADFNFANTYGVQGSPTLFINGQKADEFGFGGRTAEALKQVVCCGTTTQPQACSQVLSTETAATGFSAGYAGTGTSSSATNCPTP